MTGRMDDLHREQVAFNVDHASFDLFRAAVLIQRVSGEEVDSLALDEALEDLAHTVERAMAHAESERERVVTLRSPVEAITRGTERILWRKFKCF